MSPSHCGASTRPKAFLTAWAPTRISISRLHSLAFALTVYASCERSPAQHARLVSGCWLGTTGWDWLRYPQGSIERFQFCVLHPFPLSQASPGAIKALLKNHRLAAIEGEGQAVVGTHGNRGSKEHPLAIHATKGFLRREIGNGALMRSFDNAARY